MKIEMDISQSDLAVLHEEISINLDKIDELELDDKKGVETSGLISMLAVFKKSYGDKVVKKLDNQSLIRGLGKVVIKK